MTLLRMTSEHVVQLGRLVAGQFSSRAVNEALENKSECVGLCSA